MATELVQDLMLRISEVDRREIISEAKIRDERPPLLRGEGGLYRPAEVWLKKNARTLLPNLLRRIDPTDDEIASLVQEHLLQMFEQALIQRDVTVRFSHREMKHDDDQLPLSEVAATSLALTELVVSLLAANRAFGVEPEMPSIQVSAGSEKFSFTGPGSLGAGLGVILACSAGVISAPIVGPVVGGALVVVGAVDVVLNWRKL